MSASFQLHSNMSKNAYGLLAQALTYDENQQRTLALQSYDSAINSLTSYLVQFSPASEDFTLLSTEERKIVEDRIAKSRKFLDNACRRKEALSSTVFSYIKPNPLLSSITTSKKLRTYEALPIGTVLQQKRQQRLKRQSQQQQQQQQQYPSITRRNTLPIQQSLRIPPADTNKPEDPLRKNIESEILDTSPNVRWDDVYGLGDVRHALNEMIVLPALRPDLYSGLRAPGKGVLLFGSPGTGKSLISKAVATNIGATFFSISASSLNSKFHGESERLVRTLFQVARERQPSFIFIDEVDSILGSRSESEHEASRRLKTEFMVQFDGSSSSSSGSDIKNIKDNTYTNAADHDRNIPYNHGNSISSDRVYIMAATNRPQDLDDAVRRRFDRRIYVPLPNEEGRLVFLRKTIQRDDGVSWEISEPDLKKLAKRTERFSGSDLKGLCREASLMPLRELGEQISEVKAEDIRPCAMNDFERAFSIVRPSSDEALIKNLEDWNDKFGSKTIFKPITKDSKSDKKKPRQERFDRNAAPIASHQVHSTSNDGYDEGLVGNIPKRRVSLSAPSGLKPVRRIHRKPTKALLKKGDDPDWTP